MPITYVAMKRLRNENDFIACVMYWQGFKKKI